MTRFAAIGLCCQFAKAHRAPICVSSLLTLLTACGEAEVAPMGPTTTTRGEESAQGSGRDPQGLPGGDTNLPDSDTPPAASVDTPWCRVKAILDTHCTDCHDGEGTAGTPMGLTSYADLTAEMAGMRVYERLPARVHHDRAQAEGLNPMPPREPLSADELATLDAWIAAGAPSGDNPACVGEDVPSGPQEPKDAWPPAECDEVYTIRVHGEGGPGTPYTVPAGVEIAPEIVVDAPWGDEPVQAIAFRPLNDNKKVLHHWILYTADNTRAFLVGWAPGDDDRPPLPPDVGMDMPTGPQSLRFNMHYFNVNGTQAELDKSGVEVCVVKRSNFRRHHAGVTMALGSFGVLRGLAPVGAVDYPSTGSCVVSAKEPIHFLTAMPHAHAYATHMKFTVKKKDGTEIVMYDAPFVFEEQNPQPLDPPVVVEDGDSIYTTCYYTNPTGRTIRYGESSEDEMCLNLALYYPKDGFSCVGGVLTSL
jgi:hypothetical protein